MITNSGRKKLGMMKKTITTIALAIALSGCAASQEAPRQSAGSGGTVFTPTRAPEARPPAQQYRPPNYNAIGSRLENHIFEKWRAFPGKTGIAVERTDGGGIVGQRLDNLFPQQSVSKLWVALAVLDKVDRAELSLNQQVRITYDDFTMFQSIVKRRVEREGPITESLEELLRLAVTKSDNTANDKLMWLAGGPDAVNNTLASKNIRSVRFGPGERKLQSGIAGFSWKQSYGPGSAWFNARRKVSNETRRNALQRYLNNPIDGATPRGMVTALSRLARGELLSARSTKHLLRLMALTTSGPNRLKAGVPAGWQFGHKTGTGQSHAGISTGYNDVGIMTAPDGTRYAVAVLLANTTASVPKRMSLMQSITRAVGRYHYEQ